MNQRCSDPVPEKILFIDDDPVAREIYPPHLRAAGFVVEVCETGKGVAGRPDLWSFHWIITDIVMDGACGMELLNALAERPETPPVLAISGNGDYLVWAEALGATKTLRKPFSAQALAAAVTHSM